MILPAQSVHANMRYISYWSLNVQRGKFSLKNEIVFEEMQTFYREHGGTRVNMRLYMMWTGKKSGIRLVTSRPDPVEQ